MKQTDATYAVWLIEKLIEGNIDLALDSLSSAQDDENFKISDGIKELAKKLKRLSSSITEVAAGKQKSNILHVHSGDDLSTSVSLLINAFLEKEKSSNEIKLAFEKERNKLIEEDWIKSQYAKIFSSIQGVKTVEEFGNIFINEISISINAQIGTFYFKNHLKNSDNNKNTVNDECLVLAGSYGISPEQAKNIIKVGSGIVGQCAKDLKSRYMLEIPTGFINIESSIGKANPRCVAVIPILHENKLQAVFELALLSQLTSSQKNLIEQISENLGTSLLNISQNMLTKNLYDEIAKKNYTLATQKQALDISAIVAETDTNGRITYVNDKFLEISKYQREDLLGQDHRILNSGYHQKTFFASLWNTIKKGDVWKNEVKNKAKDGTLYWVDTTIYPVKNEQGQLLKFVAIRFDITDKKTAQAELEKATLEAKKTADTKSSFLANMSHEIRTPLNGVIGFTGLLLDQKLSPEALEQVNKIKSCSESLLMIINDILDFSKIDAGKLRIEHIPVDLKMTAEVAIMVFDKNIANKKITINSKIAEDVPARVIGDPLRIRQILLNLIGNAIKFTDAGSIDISFAVNKKIDEKRIEIICKVKDTGIGIPKKAQKKLFKSFEQADRTTSRKYGGTGLGLSICEKLIVMMGGKIWVESEEGQGATFIFTIPTRAVQMKEQKNPTLEVNVCKNINTEQLKILVAEDNIINQKLVLGLLKKFGHESVDIVENGREAIDSLNAKDYDVIFMDVHMPVMDGFQATKLIKKIHHHDIIIIGLSANIFTENKMKCQEVGMDEYLEKPIDINKFKETLQNVVTRINARKSKKAS